MSPNVESKPSGMPLPVGLLGPVVTILLAIIGSITAAYYTKGADATRLTVLESQVRDNKAERDRQIGDLKQGTMQRGEFDAWRDIYMKSVQQDLLEIKQGIKDIRSEILNDARQSRR